MELQTHENRVKAIQFLQKATKDDITDLAIKAIAQLQKMEPLLTQGEKNLMNLAIGWMDSIFRPDNEKRRQTALALNRGIQKKVARLKTQIKSGLRDITSDKFNQIKDAVDKITKMNLQIKDMSGIMRIILEQAITLVLKLFSVVGLIAFGASPFGLASVAFSGIAVVIGYLITEGMAVHQRYTALEEVIEKYKVIDAQISHLVKIETPKL